MLSTTRLGSCKPAASTGAYPLCKSPKSEAAIAAYLSFSVIKVALMLFGKNPSLPLI
jgi:hypothetical protein